MLYNNYNVIREETIEALNGVGTLFEHKKSGARVFIIKNDDDNKVFNIAFRTPPNDDTGLPHILEHSVLCGSKKYPVKDPFIELAKGSLNTFLNAMTYSDKTMYPVASCNNKDFRNLTDVYLDAVLYPNIYKEPRILKQEGWHYELEGLDQDVTYNGVVYNEMKGATSSPERILFKEIQGALFPNHTYGCDSGGDPENIPDLTQEVFLAFHKTYYHPSNSYIFMYGDLDVEEQLSWLDQAYLCEFDKITVDSEIKLVEGMKECVSKSIPYAISSEESTDRKSYLSYNVVINHSSDHSETLGLEILEYLLLEAPGAPLKEALLELNIAEDIFGSYDSGIRQHIFSVVAKNANTEDEGIFLTTIETVLRKILKEGLSNRKIEAAINYFEFKTREADFGQHPRGVIYAVNALDTWLYDGDPFENFAYDKAFAVLREGVENGYFSQLISKYLLDNRHSATVMLTPDPNLLNEKEVKLKTKLKTYTNNLTETEKVALIEETKALKIYQESPNSKEDLETIPLLELDDIKKEAAKTVYTVNEHNQVTYITHETFTNNIVYMRLLFDLSVLSFDEVPYAGLLSNLLMKLDTQNYSYSDLSDEINIHTGGISTRVAVYGVQNNTDECQPKFEVRFKCFNAQVDETIELVKEIVLKTIFDNTKRIMDIVAETKSRLSMALSQSGHTAAMTRSLSYHTIAGKYRDLIGGIGYYKFIEKLAEEDDLQAIALKLQSVLNQLIRQENTCVLINTEKRYIKDVTTKVESFVACLDSTVSEDKEEEVAFESLNEGFKIASKVQYCALTGDFIKEGYKYNGYMRVLQTIMSLDYMWTEVRIKGGAYGGFAGFRSGGTFFLGSYRDPNIKKTYEIFSELPKYIRGIDLDSRELLKYIIGTISNYDIPLTPQGMGERAIGLYLAGVSYEEEQQLRDEVLTTSNSDIVALAEIVEKLIAQNNICVIGNESKIEEDKDILIEVKSLFK